MDQCEAERKVSTPVELQREREGARRGMPKTPRALKSRVYLIIAGVAFVNAAGTQIASAAGGYESGDTLLSLCEKPQDSTLYGFCAGYIIGAADALDEGLFCPPKGHAKQQIVDVTVRWLRDNPENRDDTAHSLVARALAENFPCN
jgi:hypothetical protein